MSPSFKAGTSSFIAQIVGINEETVTNITSTDFPGHYPGEDHAWDKDQFEDNLQIQFHKNEKYDASFSVVGIDASIANAFRRIMIAEVATFAIEVVMTYNNTSIVQDEVLSHRLGLIPLTGSRAGFDKMDWWTPSAENPDDKSLNATDLNTLQMNLSVRCTKNRDAAENEEEPTKLYHNAHVYARDLKFQPNGKQTEWFSEEHGPVRAQNPDILIAKLRPGQEIELIAYARKGNGADHAKFSPVATATYRLLPLIQIIKPIVGEDAKKFAKCFLPGVVGLETVTEDDAVKDKQYRSHIGEQRAVVRNAFKDSVSRECLRHEEFKGKVKLGRIQDHFIFSVESTGQYQSDEIFLQSVQTLKSKIEVLKSDLETINH